MEKVTAEQIYAQYQRLKHNEEQERAIWRDCYEYTNNRVGGQLGQWKSEWRDQMGQRPMLSFNEMRKFLNRICGNQRATKLDEKVIPVDDVSDPVIAQILNDLVKHVYRINKADKMPIARAFRDMIICGRGFVKAEWSDELNPAGEVRLKSVNPFRIYLVGDGEMYDLSDRKGIMEELPLTKEDLIALYPDKKQAIQDLSFDEEKEVTTAGEDYTGGSEEENSFFKEDQKLTALRYQRWEYTKVQFYQSPDGELLPIAKDAPPLPWPKISKMVRSVRVTVSVGPVMLEDKISQYKHNRFDIVGFFAYLDAGQITSVMQDLLDPQNEKNKRRSAIIHILNISPKNNYFVQKGKIDNLGDAAKRMGGYGQFIEINGPINESVQPIESNLSAVPAIIQMEQEATQDMKEISGLHDAALGEVPEGVKSGRGISALQKPTETIIAELFDNYLLSRELLASLVLALVQQFYTDTRRVRILGDYHPLFLPPQIKDMYAQLLAQVKGANPLLSDEEAAKETLKLLEVVPGGKIIGINIQIGQKKLNDISVGKFDVEIDHVSQNPTSRRERYYDLLNLASIFGPIIPPRAIIEASDMSNKEELIQQIEQNIMMQQQTQIAGASPEGRAPTPALNSPQEGDILYNAAGVQAPI